MINDLERSRQNQLIFIFLSSKCVSFLLSNKLKSNYVYPYVGKVQYFNQVGHFQPNSQVDEVTLLPMNFSAKC